MAKFLGGSRAVRCVRMAAWLACVCTVWLHVGVADPGTANGAAGRIGWLQAEIARHDELYFKRATPEISDEAYDRLKRELAELERSSGVAGSGEVFGDDRDGKFAAAPHGSRMMSLAKVYSETELRTFLKRVEGETGMNAVWMVEPKYDGLAVSATYEGGRLVRLATRGNGIEGEDVTANAAAIAGLPKTLSGETWPERIEMRGEVFVSYAEFERVNSERAEAGEPLFANPRALAAGSLKLSDPGEVARRGLSVVFYGWGDVAPKAAEPRSQHGFHEHVCAWGLPGVTEPRLARNADDVMRWVTIFEKNRSSLAFPTDGVVIKLDDVDIREKLGATEHAPRWAVAYKFSTEKAMTLVRGITLQVGRTGVLTPVAELEPVWLGGSTIARATLHNASEIARLDVRVSDAVWIEKAGEIIPAVIGVDKVHRREGVAAFVFPEDCPVCGAAVVTRSDEGVLQFCPNTDCEAQVIARLRHFTGPQGVAIRGLGEEMLKPLVKTRGVRSIDDLYRLKKKDWLELPGIGAKSAEKLAAGIDTSKRAELWRFVNGLGVRGVGVATSRALAKRFATLDALSAATETELRELDGVGERQAQELVMFFSDPRNQRMLDALRASGVQPLNRSRTTAAAGKTFVLTGALPTLTRMEAEERILAAGGIVGGSVTSRTDFVVAGANAGEKWKRAVELGVRIIGQEELLLLLSGSVTDQ